jgi:hypothetical protein
MLCFFFVILDLWTLLLQTANVVAFNTLNTSYTIITYDYVQTAYAYIVVLPFLYIFRVSIGTGQTACHGARMRNERLGISMKTAAIAE